MGRQRQTIERMISRVNRGIGSVVGLSISNSDQFLCIYRNIYKREYIGGRGRMIGNRIEKQEREEDFVWGREGDL